MGTIYNKFIEYYNGKNFNLTPTPFMAEDTYNQIGEVRKRSAEAILSLENLIESTHNKNHTHDDRYYLKNEIDIKIANVASNGHIDLSSYATVESLKAKVDKVEGKTLTSNDYTNAEKAKLAELANYVHPSTHDARMIFFSDGQDLQLKLNNGSLGSGSGGGGTGGGTGEAGKDGATWYSIEGTPTSALGNIGDFCIDKNSYNYYRKLSSSIWNLEGNLKGGTGQAGANGIDGKSIEYQWNGTYLQLRQSGGSWGTAVNLKGDKGDIGDTGDTGVGLNFIWQGTSLGVKREDESSYKTMNIQGEKGDKGDTTDIKIGTVSLGNSETDYALTMTGTAPNLTLNMKIPRGQKGDTGETGQSGSDGRGLEFVWLGTQLGVRKSGDSSYNYVDLKGATGATGANGTNGSNGKSIEYQWIGTSLQLRQEGGSWGSSVNLVGKSIEFAWSGTSLRLRQEGGTWGSYVNLKGDKGDTGANGTNGSDGARGKAIEYQWVGTSLQLRIEGEAWGSAVDLQGRMVNQNGGGELKIWYGTQSEYDDVSPKDPDTLYFLKENMPY